jgi:hypothetical protein
LWQDCENFSTESCFLHLFTYELDFIEIGSWDMRNIKKAKKK